MNLYYCLPTIFLIVPFLWTIVISQEIDLPTLHAEVHALADDIARMKILKDKLRKDLNLLEGKFNNTLQEIPIIRKQLQDQINQMWDEWWPSITNISQIGSRLSVLETNHNDLAAKVAAIGKAEGVTEHDLLKVDAKVNKLGTQMSNHKKMANDNFRVLNKTIGEIRRKWSSRGKRSVGFEPFNLCYDYDK